MVSVHPPVEVHEEDSGPGDYSHVSTVYVWHDEGQSWAFHLAPTGVAKDELRLGTITRTAYHTLETVDAIRDANGFLMLHFLPDSNNVDITMLPVGEEQAREALDAELKNRSGFQAVFSRIVELCKSDRADCVRVLYNAPKDLGDASKLAIVHELNARIEPGVVRDFLRVSTGV